MRELARRVAVLTILSTAGISLLAPVATGSAQRIDTQTVRLLSAAGEPLNGVPRTRLSGREQSASLTLADISRALAPEALAAASAPLPPAGVAFSARFAPIATPPPILRSAPPPPMTGSTISGKATYYCCSLGYRGQAVVALPGALGGRYDAPPAARFVTICAERCARLPVVDFCGCYWGTASQKVADLSPEAWASISGSNRMVLGVLQVTIRLG